MMSKNMADMEAGGQFEQQQPDWWVVRYASWLATMGALALTFLGVVGVVFNTVTFALYSLISSLLQIFAAGIILAVEGSSLVAWLPFTKPISLFFDGKPIYMRAILYGILSIIPMLLNPSSVAVYLGFITSAAITGVYATVIIGKKGSIEDMKAAAGDSIPKI